MKTRRFLPIAIVLTWMCCMTIKAQPHRDRPMIDILSEDLDVHDPVLAQENGKYYLCCTGWGISLISSADSMKTWKVEKPILDPIPEWPKAHVPAYKGHTWAPDISRINDRWYLYYSCSTFGKNISAIGLATNKTLDPSSPDYKWEDQGMVIESTPGVTEWNAIDPNLILDQEGNAWLNWGSFWDGIQIVRLDKDLKTPIGQPKTIARRRDPQDLIPVNGKSKPDPIEAPFIIYREGWYYLFVSWDYCCKGLQSNYRTMVGRCQTIDGIYLDRDGKEMLVGGGTPVAGPNERYSGIGHCSVYKMDGRWLFVAHGYDKEKNGASKLFLKELTWIDGWPVLKKEL